MPSGLTVTYGLFKPTEYDFKITSSSSSVSFNFTHEYALNGTFEVEYIAFVNTTLYTTNRYNVTTSCRTECQY